MNKQLKLPAWSYSFLSTFSRCPKQAYHQYVAKDLPWVEPSEQLKWGRKVHEALDARVKLGRPLPEGMGHWEDLARTFTGMSVQTELKLGIDGEGMACGFFAHAVWGRGALDVMVLGGTGTAWIVDWKTGKRREDPMELQLHAFLLKAHYPQLVQIVGQYVWLTESRGGEYHDCSNTEQTQRHIEAMWLQVLRSYQDDIWPAVKTPLCGWCPVKTCRNHPGG